MLKDIGDGCRLEPRIDGVEHGAEHRHAVMRLDHRGHIGQHRRNRVARPDAGACERGRQLPRSVVELPVIIAARPVDHRDALGMDFGRTRQERNRRQAREIRGVRSQACEDPAARGAAFLGAVGPFRGLPRAERRISARLVLRTTLPDLPGPFRLWPLGFRPFALSLSRHSIASVPAWQVKADARQTDDWSGRRAGAHLNDRQGRNTMSEIRHSGRVDRAGQRLPFRMRSVAGT